MPAERPLSGTEQLAARVDAARKGGLLSSDAGSGRGVRRRRTAIDSPIGLPGIDGEAKRGLTKGEIAKVLTIAAAAGAGAGLADIFMIVTQLHRADTHRSIEPHPLFTKLVDLSQRSLGVSDRKTWADVHLDHHGYADVNIFPMLRVSRAVEWLEAEQREGRMLGVTIPDNFKYLDPRVDNGEYSRDEVMEIGKLAEQRVRTRMGDLYKPPEMYTEAELRDIFSPTEFAFYYPKYKKVEPDEYTSDMLAHILLRDPHSPIYADRSGKNGVKEIFMWGYWPYKSAIDARITFPEITTPHLQNPPDEKRKSVMPAVVGGVAIPALVTFLARGGKHGPEDIALAVASGVVFDVTRVLVEVMGAMTVNAVGHAGGELTTKKILKAILMTDFDIRLNPDGTVAADTTVAGWLGRLISRITADEVGRQWYHHEFPGAIKYGDKEGAEGFKETPVGSVIESIVRSRIPLFEAGDNFEGILPPGEIRPDLPQAATLIVQRRRQRQYKIEEEEGRTRPIFSAN